MGHMNVEPSDTFLVSCLLDVGVWMSGRFVIAAQAERSVGNYTERYYWLQPVSLESGQRIQNLSNNNLTSATGTSSLVLTKD